MHDPSSATHVFIHRVLGTFLLRRVEIRNSGLIYADYGRVSEKTGAFSGWFSETEPDDDPWPGLFVPASGRLTTYRAWTQDRARARAFEKMILFAERYGQTCGEWRQ